MAGGNPSMTRETRFCRQSLNRSETLCFWSSEAPAGGDQQGTQSRGSAATQGQRAAEDDRGVDRGGCWARASAPALQADVVKTLF